MNGFCGKAFVGVGLCVAVLWVVVPSAAELADVYLKSGLRLRGDVTTTEDEVIVRNAAGELRLPRAEVERVVPVALADRQPSTRAAVPTETQPTGTTGEEKPATRPAEPPAAGEPEKPVQQVLPPAPPLSETDIHRLKLHELTLDGPAEMVRVRFKRKGRQQDLPREILEQLRRRADYEPAWQEVLIRGRAHEKLQFIVLQTGAEYVDRIEIQNDPQVFETFRRRVLPLVNRGCARGGCHAGKSARLFRFPIGSTSSESCAYTTFVLLDQLETEHGPLLDRRNPVDSVLLHYMMPQENNRRPHPPVGRGPSFKPVIRNKDDRHYSAVLDWINSLMVPQPDYDLEYKNPYAGRLAAPAAEAEREGQKEVREHEPAESQPTADEVEDSSRQ